MDEGISGVYLEADATCETIRYAYSMLLYSALLTGFDGEIGDYCRRRGKGN